MYDIIAFTEISRGNIDKAKKIIPIIQEINDNNIGNVNANRILSVQARLFLAEGKYQLLPAQAGSLGQRLQSGLKA